MYLHVIAVRFPGNQRILQEVTVPSRCSLRNCSVYKPPLKKKSCHIVFVHELNKMSDTVHFRGVGRSSFELPEKLFPLRPVFMLS